MTNDQYLDLKNEYRVMMEELRRYNEHRAPQQGPIMQRQYSLRSNLEPEQFDSQEAQASSESWKSQYSSTKRSSGASEPSSIRSRRKKSQIDQINHVTKAELKNIIRELQQLKKFRLGQDLDPDVKNNPLSLTIQSKIISLAIRSSRSCGNF